MEQNRMNGNHHSGAARGPGNANPTTFLLRYLFGSAFNSCMETTSATSVNVRRLVSSPSLAIKEQEFEQHEVEVRMLRRDREKTEAGIGAVIKKLEVLLEQLERSKLEERREANFRLFRTFALLVITFSVFGYVSTGSSGVLMSLVIWEMRNTEIDRQVDKSVIENITISLKALRVTGPETSVASGNSARPRPNTPGGSVPLGRSYSLNEVSSKPSSRSLGAESRASVGQNVVPRSFRNRSLSESVSSNMTGRTGSPTSAVPFLVYRPPTIFDSKGFRLNILQDLDLDFENVVLKALPRDKQDLFVVFKREFMKDPIVNRLHPYSMPDEFTLMRFLQVEGFDVKRALHRLVKALEWWDSSGFDAFMDNVDWKLVKRAKALRPIHFCGLDKRRHPVIVEKIGEFFGNELVWKGLDTSAWRRYQPFLLGEFTSYFRLVARQNGTVEHQLSIIADASGFKLRAALLMIPFVRMLVEVERYFPFLTDCTVINAPAWFSIFWSVIETILDPGVVQSVRIFPDSAKEFLLDHYGADCVPVVYGGKCEVDIFSCPQLLDEQFEASFPLE